MRAIAATSKDRAALLNGPVEDVFCCKGAAIGAGGLGKRR
jgi:hypothetical protein